MGADHPRRGRVLARRVLDSRRLGGRARPRQLLAFQPARLRRRSTHRALRVAVSKIGMPYVWGGETDGVASYGPGARRLRLLGLRLARLQALGRPAGARIGGRTAAQMAGEIPKRERVRLDDVRPGDLLFFGSASFNAKATEAGVDHVGIALSRDWMIHSSGQGVYVSRSTRAGGASASPGRAACSKNV